MLTNTMKQLVKESISISKVIVFCFIFFTISNSILPLLYSLFVGTVTSRLIGNIDILDFLLVMLIFFSPILLCNIVKSFSQYKGDTIITYIRMTFSNKLNEKLFRAPYSLIESEAFHSENHRAFTSLNSSQTGVEKICQLIFILPASLISVFAIAVLFANLRIIVSIQVILFLFIRIYVNRRVANYHQGRKLEASRLERKLEYIFQSTQDSSMNKELRVYSSEGLLKAMSKKIINDWNSILKQLRLYETKLDSLSWVFTFLMIATFCIAIIDGYRNELLDVGHVMMYTTALLQVIEISDEISNNFKTLFIESISVSELFEFLDSEDSQGLTIHNNISSVVNKEQLFEVSNLSFRYPNSCKEILSNVNIIIKRGERVAIVGQNGVGKSTLIKCITGLYTEYSGEIKLYGIDIKLLSPTRLYEYIGALYQEVCLYAFSLKENIASRSENIDNDKVFSCLNIVGLSAFRESDLLESYVLKSMDKDGLEFSGGQKQKLALARLLYKNPEIIVLDEPTSALDCLAEESLLTEINELTKGKTCIFVTHRLNSIKDFDRILLIDDGNIAEEGTHDELMKLGKEYSRLYTLQAKYYED